MRRWATTLLVIGLGLLAGYLTAIKFKEWQSSRYPIVKTDGNIEITMTTRIPGVN